jgi:hypothetical protein
VELEENGGMSDEEVRAQARKISFVISIFMTIVAVAIGFYYSKMRATTKPILRGVYSGITIGSDLQRVYDYVSTPDFRTEWHMGSVEVAGPAIDHSAVVGERFAEELHLGAHELHLDWHVVDRQFPTSTATHLAEFVLEGTATRVKRGHSSKEHWRHVPLSILVLLLFPSAASV